MGAAGDSLGVLVIIIGAMLAAHRLSERAEIVLLAVGIAIGLGVFAAVL